MFYQGLARTVTDKHGTDAFFGGDTHRRSRTVFRLPINQFAVRRHTAVFASTAQSATKQE